MKKKNSVFVLSLLTLLSLSACGNKQTDTSSTPSPTSSAPKASSSEKSNQESSEQSTVVQKFKVTYPENPDIYTIAVEAGSSFTDIEKNGRASFKINFTEAYSQKRNLVVKANDVQLAAVEDVYTISNIEADVTLTITVDKNVYTVKWMNGDTAIETDTDVPYGTRATYDGEKPTKEKTLEFTYVFDYWADDKGNKAEIENLTVTSDLTLHAHYQENKNTYTVTWKDGDTVLETDTDVPYGTKASFDKGTPTKEKTAEFSYTFDYWMDAEGKEVKDLTVSGDMTLTAHYKETRNSYEVNWMNGGSLLVAEQIPYGTTASYNGDTPTKEGDAQYRYTFDYWADKDGNKITDFKVTGARDFYAHFSQTTNKYTVTFDSDGGTAVDAQTIEYGGKATEPTAISKATDPTYSYKFLGWFNGDTEFNFNTEIHENVALKAHWSNIPNYDYALANSQNNDHPFGIAESTINNGAKGGLWAHYDASNTYFDNSVVYHTYNGEGETTFSATLALPKVNYTEFKTDVLYNFYMTNNTTLGFDSTETIGEAGADRYGIILFRDITAESMTVTISTNKYKGLNNESITKTITDKDIINGTKPLSLYMNRLNQYDRKLFLSRIGTEVKLPKKCDAGNPSFFDSYASMNGQKGDNVCSKNDGDVNYRTWGNKYASGVSARCSNDSDHREMSYQVAFLPLRIAGTKKITIKIANTDNGQAAYYGFKIGPNADNNVEIGANECTLTITNADGKVTLTVTDDVDATKTVSWTLDDKDIYYGLKGISFYFGFTNNSTWTNLINFSVPTIE